MNFKPSAGFRTASAVRSATLSLRKRRKDFSTTALVIVAASASSHAVGADDPMPYYVGVSQTVTADSNVFRVREGSPHPRDLISTTGLVAGLDQPLGRGRLVVDLNLDKNNFRNNKQLNYTGSQGKLRLDWETINRISGDISLHQQQSLYRSDPSISTVVTNRDVLRNSGADVRARIGLVTRWSLEGGASYNQSRHSSSDLRNQDLNQTSANLGVRLRPNDLWSVRLGVRETRAEYPRLVTTSTGQTLADEVRRHDIDLSGDWSPTGASQLDARLSSTRDRHSLLGARNGHTWTGLVGYNWLITGKTRLRAQLSRDSNIGNTDSDLRTTAQSNDLADASRSDAQLHNRLTLEGKWEASSKISTDASYSHSRRTLSDSQALAGGLAVTERDRVNVMGIGFTYRPRQTVQLGCKYSHEQRSAPQNATLTYPYKVDMGSCQVQVRI